MIIMFLCMGKENKNEVQKYGREDLLNDLNSQATSGGNPNSDIRIRLKWLSQILDIDKAEKDSETILKQFKINVENDSHLFAFTCHLASKKQFAHTFSYLNHQKDCYIKRIAEIETFIDSMLANAQEFFDVFGEDEKFSITVNDVFTFCFDIDTKGFHGKVKWEKCFELIDISKQYYVKLFYKTIPLFVMKCEIGDKITDILKEWKEIGKNAQK